MKKTRMEIMAGKTHFFSCLQPQYVIKDNLSLPIDKFLLHKQYFNFGKEM